MTTLLENPVTEKEGPSLRVKLFTHNDLDGIGCVVVANRAFGKDNVSVEYNAYETVDDNVYKFLFSEAYEEVDAVFITDISVSEGLAEIIDSSFAGKVQLIDHHGTALWLNKHSWAIVSVNENSLPGVSDGRGERLASGTSLFFQYLWDNGILKDESMVDFVEQVRRYDSWEWQNVYNSTPVPRQLNTLFSLLGRYEFVDRFTSNPEVIFSSTERKLVLVEDKRMDNYIKSKKDKMFEADVLGYNAGVVFAEQYHSELGNSLAIENPHLSFIVIANPEGKLSFRGIHNDIDIGKEVASRLGGGGHPKAAGGKFDYELSKSFMSVVFKRAQT